MKKCTNCGEIKLLEEFQRRARSKDGHTNLCKPCKRSYDNNHYKNNPDRRAYIRSNSDYRIERIQKWIMSYLLCHPCVDCGEIDPIVLEFDHRGDKEFAIAARIKNGGLLSVQQEIEKCDVRCANCHRRKTARDFGWWKTKIGCDMEL